MIRAMKIFGVIVFAAIVGVMAVIFSPALIKEKLSKKKRDQETLFL